MTLVPHEASKDSWVDLAFDGSSESHILPMPLVAPRKPWDDKAKLAGFCSWGTSAGKGQRPCQYGSQRLLLLAFTAIMQDAPE